MNDIWNEIAAELLRQQREHPHDHIGLGRWSNPDRYAILAAEVGEVAEEVTLGMRGPAKRGINPTPVALRTALVQVAACAVAWIDLSDRREADRT